ncbi:initiation factor 2 [Rhypophila decipiens]
MIRSGLRQSASGGGWGRPGGAWGSGLKRDPELEARIARDREERQAKEREEREAKRAKERDILKQSRHRPSAPPPHGSNTTNLVRRVHMGGSSPDQRGQVSQFTSKFSELRKGDLPSRPERRQPTGSEHLPWQANISRERTPQDDERRRSGFWGQAEARFREQDTDRTSRPYSQNISRDSAGSSFRRFGDVQNRNAGNRDRPEASLQRSQTTPGIDDWLPTASPGGTRSRPDSSRKPEISSNSHLKEAATRQQQSSPNELAEGTNREPSFTRSGRPERPDKRHSRPRARRSGEEEDEDLDLDAIKERRRLKAERKAERERERLAALEAAGPTRILLPEFISVANLALALGQMLELGILTGETAAIIAEEYGFEPTVEEGEGRDLKPAPPAEDPSSLPPRPPVVTIMGHVDHGKTTLLDWLRKSSIAAGEHGGITQHIGAFSVKLSSGKPITFLDTPGHAAFTQMRQRGANVTDIAILVVAADDSVKPQTIEALKHARAAKVPIIVAITKVDKPDANIEKVKSDLAGQGVEIEDYGGDVQVVGVSGKTGEGMDDLEENILLLSDILDIRAETDGMAEGWVLESSIKPYGRSATVLVKRGTLRIGDWIVAGTISARIRSLRNEAGVEVDAAPPGTAVEVLGWKDQDPPNAGDQVLQAPSKDKADDARDREEAVAQMAEQGQQRREREREKAAAEAAEAAGDVVEEPEEPGTKLVNFTIKGDVHGSVEAVCAAVQEIGSNEVRPRILMSSPGQVTESDVDHAAVSGSCIINFNNPVSGHIKRLAMNSKVRILDHNIIYHMAEEVKDVLSELLPPTISNKVVGEAEILQVFSINVKGRVYKNIAGCRIRNGYIKRDSTVRIMRGDEEVFTGAIETLKQGKKAATEVKKGAECGVSFEEWEDFMQGDQIQVIEEVVTKRRLQ